MSSLLEKLALKTLEKNKVQVWVTALLEIGGGGETKVLRAFTKVAKTSAVKQATTPKKKKQERPEKKLSKIEDGGALF